MSKTLTIRVDEQTYVMLKNHALAQNRSLSNFIETTVKEHIQESEFLDKEEMSDILTNKKLVERLRRGSHDAEKKKGKLIG